MNASTLRDRLSGDVDDKVADLTEEVVLVHPPVGAIIFIRVGVDDGHAGERGSSLESRGVGSIAHELGVVVLNNRLADEVCAGREVDHSRSDGRRLAVQATTSTRGDGAVDGICVVGDSITLGAKVCNAAEDAVGVVTTKRHGTLTGDGGDPVAGAGRSSGGGLRSWDRKSGECQCQARDELRKDHLKE